MISRGKLSSGETFAKNNVIIAGDEAVSAGPDFRKAFEICSMPKAIIDCDLRFVAVNQAYERATMLSREALIGRYFFDVLPSSGEARQRVHNSLREVIATGAADTIALVAYEMQLPPERGGGTEMRYWSARHAPIVDAAGNVEFVLLSPNDVTEIATARLQTATLESDTTAMTLWQNAETVEAAYQQTMAKNEEFRRLFSQAPGMIAVFEGAELRPTFASDSFMRFIGGTQLAEKPLLEWLPELRDQPFIAMLHDAMERGESVSRESMKIRLHHPGSPYEAVSLVDFFCNPVRDSDGEIYGVIAQGIDRTEALRAAHHQRTLMDELNHRVKNTLATIQSMARQTFREPVDLDAARYAFEARIMALSRVHNILADRRWEAVPLTALFRHVNQGIDPGRLVLDGGDVMLSPKTGVALAIVIHELFANARLHGALTRADGKIEVSWRHVDDRLVLQWRETSGDGGDGEELRPGFGIRILRSIVSGELGGMVSIELSEGNLICSLDVDTSEVGEIAL
ncbi:sensor histidine kinase [Jiella flava]|nr:PAS domain-containing protein [Jiella flava]